MWPSPDAYDESADPPLISAITGCSWRCCAPVVNGHAAAPLSAAMNSRRRRQMLIWTSRASQWTKPETAGQQAIGDRRPTEARP
jgi:hypothetical protein